MDFNPHKPLPLLYKEAPPENYFKVETEWMAAEGYPESKEAILRKVALRLILQSSKYDELEPFIPYLAVNFFDRFISRNELPHVVGRLRDDIVLTAHCCLLMAWKMRDVCSFSYLQFVEKRKMNLDFTKHLMKMELKILQGLKWQKMRTITPICFVDFFVGKMPLAKGIKLGTIKQIIIETQDDISFTRFRPSVIAASALLSACILLYNDQYNSNKKILLASVGNYLIEDDLEVCLKKTYEMCIEKKIYLEKVEGFKELTEEPQLNLEVVAGEITEVRDQIIEVGETSSSISHRTGKEPMVEQQAEVKEEAGEREINQEVNFELKWMKWRSEEYPDEDSLDSPKYRSPAPAEDPKVIKERNLPSWTHPRYQHYGCCGICRRYGYCTCTTCNLL